MKKYFFPPVVLFLITLIFFYPILKGYIPFPGDLLVSTSPYSSYSFLGFAPGGVPNKAQGPDVMHELYPWKYFVIDSLKSGEIPFWTPYNFSGNTMMANFQSATFYPLNFIFFLGSFLNGWTIFIFSAPFLASFFTYLFLRTLKISKISSVFGGIVFAFSSYMVVWMEYGNITHTLMWLPLVLYFTEKYIQRENWKDVLLIIFSLWFSFLAGYIQGFFYLFTIVIIYFAVKTSLFDKKNLKKKIVFLIALIFPILLSLFQLLPTLDLFKMSSRDNYSLAEITQLLNPWWYSITTFIPDFFGNPASRNSWFYGTYIERVSFFGVIPLLFALVALFSPKKIETKMFTALFIISFILSLDLFFTRFFYLLPIPVISTTVPTRILSVFVFSGAVLAAYGLDLFLQKKQRKQFILISFIGTGLLVAMWVYVFVFTKDNPNLLIAKRNLVLPTFWQIIFSGVVLLSFSKIIKRIVFSQTILILFLFAATIADLFYFFHKITPFSPREFIFPKTSVISFLQENSGINRYWGYGSAHIDSNFQTLDKTFTPNGFDALHIKWYTEFISASKNGKISETISRDNANVAPGYGTGDLQTNEYRQKALNILGVKYILHKNEILEDESKYVPDIATFNEKKYKLIWQEKPWQIYENKQVLPRVFLAFNYETLDKNSIVKRFFDKDFDPRKTVLLEEKLPMILGYDENASVTVKEYKPNRIVIETNSKANALLFLSDNYYPDWNITIDGKHAKVYKADYTFRAVPVEKGKHEVIFLYNPKSFYLGIKLSLLAFFTLLLSLIILNKKKLFK